MRKPLFLSLSLAAGFIASCGGGYGGDSSTSSASALFGEGSKALKPAQAQCTITVSDSLDIQTALNTARTNGRDDVVCIPAGTYNITSTLNYVLPSNSSECGKKLTIRAVGGDVILDGGNSVRILRIDTYNCSDDTGGDITIEGITFQKGRAVNNAGGGVLANDGGGLLVLTRNANITLTNNTFSNNRAGSSGGAGVSSDSGSITLTNNTFSNNRAGSSGGAGVYSDSGSITLTNNTFSGNSADFGGGGAYISSYSGSITLTNNIFSGNSAVRDETNYLGGRSVGGGADVSSYSGSITLTNNTFSNNNALDDGGGVYVYLHNARLDFYNNIFWNNTANANGEDLYVDNYNNHSPVNLAHNLFSTTETPIDFSTAPQTKKVYIVKADGYNQNIANGCTNSENFGNIQADPKFVDPQNGNLRLQENSPAIDVGCNSAPSLPNTDRDGNPRIVGNTVDMGAYEYQGQQQDEQQGGGQNGDNGGQTGDGQNGDNDGQTGGGGGQPQPQPQPGTGQTGGGGGGCSMGGTADASMLWWLVPPVLALVRRLRRSA
ncbi:MAG: right-handed parallel beta-helix repeat-containing protein [Desulfurococcaceae archaeon]